MKTLYLSDLDGTLLRQNQRVSDVTVSVINRLQKRGAIFSYATARSFYTAGEIMKDCAVTAPVIVHNGAFIVDGNGKTLFFDGFQKEEGREIYAAFTERGLYPLVYAEIEGRNRFTYHISGAAQSAFLETRLGVHDTHRRAREISNPARALDGDVYYFACIDEAEKLRPVYEALRSKYRCFYSRDIYSGEFWLEVLSKTASKAAAALRLKEMLGCDRLVCFGDETNDIPLFQIADECYAVGNAAEELKQLATAVIGTNEEDGVARWLCENARE